MVQCRFCDHRNATGAVRCASCGAELSADEPAATPATGDPLDDQVLHLLASRGKIAAIKHYREQTNSGLKDAKDAVEALAARHGVAPARGAGCAGVVALVTIALLVLAGT